MLKDRLYFLLGGPDVEMTSIQSGLQKLGIPHGYATVDGKPVFSSNAYKANGLKDLGLAAETHVVLVECYDPHVAQLCPDHDRADHHNPGDPGYGLPPEDYAFASSIGQVIRLLIGFGVIQDLQEAETHFPNWKMVAAGDHCPAASFLGKCPGIDVEAFREFRLENAASFQQRDKEELRAEITDSIERLMALPEVTHQGVSWKDAIGHEIPSLHHATSWTATPCAYSMALPDGRTKVGIIGSDEPAVVRAWWDYYTPHLVDMYGDPARGFAGGYLPSGN